VRGFRLRLRARGVKIPSRRRVKVYLKRSFAKNGALYTVASLHDAHALRSFMAFGHVGTYVGIDLAKPGSDQIVVRDLNFGRPVDPAHVTP